MHKHAKMISVYTVALIFQFYHQQEDPGEFDFDIPTKIGEGTAKIPSEETKIPVKEVNDSKLLFFINSIQ